jgi:hypothetical protein
VPSGRATGRRSSAPSPQSLVALVTTFVATLVLPISAAVGLGVVLSLLLQLNREAVDLRVVERVPLTHGMVGATPLSYERRSASFHAVWAMSDRS